MLGLKLNHVSKRGHRRDDCAHLNQELEFKWISVYSRKKATIRNWNINQVPASNYAIVGLDTWDKPLSEPMLF